MMEMVGNQGIIHILCKWQITGQAAYITHGDTQAVVSGVAP